MPIEVTEVPIVNEVKPEQAVKAFLPMEITELGITKSPVNFEQPLNA